MESLATSNGWKAPASAEAVSLPRRHVVAIAALACIPLPLLSLGAALVPLPQLLERAAASFVAIAVPSSGDERLIREKTASSALEIVYRSDEPASVRQGVVPSQDTTPTGGAREFRTRTGETAKRKQSTGRKGSVAIRSQPLETGEAETGKPASQQASDSTPTASEGRLQGSQASGTPEAPASKPGGGQSGAGGAQGGGSSGTGGGGPGKSGSGSGGSGGGGNSSGSGGGGGSGGSGAGGSSPPDPPKADPGSGGSGGGSGSGNSPTTPPRNDSAQPGGQGRP